MEPDAVIPEKALSKMITELQDQQSDRILAKTQEIEPVRIQEQQDESEPEGEDGWLIG